MSSVSGAPNDTTGTAIPPTVTRIAAFGPAWRMPPPASRTVVVTPSESGIGTVRQPPEPHSEVANVLVCPLSAHRCTTSPMTAPRASALAVKNPGATSAIMTGAVELDPSERTTATRAGPTAEVSGTRKVVSDHPAPVYSSGGGCGVVGG